MNEVALYRKYRPGSFKETLGQDDIVSVLEGAIRRGNISHAYLFSGSRGTGKTTFARIFAKAIGTTTNDLYEIDAASNRGIDDIRELRDAVNVLPLESKRKVYIIDEVHMLTKEAFNALLKTLEEPPRHVMFILATTEFEKLPETIISRCQSFTFKKPSTHVLRKMITSVAKKEGVKIDAAGAELIALLADGSFRDAHGVLQKVLASAECEITVADVEKITGAPKGSLVNDLALALGNKDVAKALNSVHCAVEGNVDMKVFIKLLLHKLRAVLLLRYAPDINQKSHFSDEDYMFLTSLSKEKGIDASLLKEFLEAYSGIGSASVPQLPIELAIVNIIK